MHSMKKSLVRAIVREARQMRSKGPDAGFQLPAIYDICNVVNPRSGGIILRSESDYRFFAKTSFNKWCISQELLDSRRLREVLPPLLAELDSPPAPTKSIEQPDFLHFDNVRCPFELLRTFKCQNAIGKAISRTVCDGLTMQAVTGYAREISQSSTGENIFSYNILFTNTGKTPVRILGQHIMYTNECKEVKTKYQRGVNHTLPVISAGEHYLCGSTVAFPEALSDMNVEGFFQIIDEGYRSGEFEKLGLDEKWEILTNAVENQGLKAYTIDLKKTKFCLDVPCDTQSLIEKLCYSEGSRGSIVGL